MTKLREIRAESAANYQGTLRGKRGVASSVESRELAILTFGAMAGDGRRYRTKKEG